MQYQKLIGREGTRTFPIAYHKGTEAEVRKIIEDSPLDNTRDRLWIASDKQIEPVTLEELWSEAHNAGGLTVAQAAMIMSLTCGQEVKKNTISKAIGYGNLIASNRPGIDWWIDYDSFDLYRLNYRPRRSRAR